ncbi:unnamed protein product [Paramecium primaurelia]|uniref:Uncharacterized protein n=2 Tax=Paramecium TaxID=5884 RepID=A0A8S1SJA1_9CILI|nr:unnamed protein product [Paramecium primaurelia]CAD8139447.1 unnamed protein product [Paramecium pentaurelia]
MSFTPRQVKSLNKDLYLTSIPYNNKFQRTFTNEEISSVSKKLDFDQFDNQVQKPTSVLKMNSLPLKGIR